MVVFRINFHRSGLNNNNFNNKCLANMMENKQQMVHIIAEIVAYDCNGILFQPKT